jgi:alpha-glucosidase
VDVQSPNGALTAKFRLVGGVPQWQLACEGAPMLEPGRLGLRLAPQDLGALKTVSAEQATHREKVATTWGKFAEYDNHFRQLQWTLREESGSQRTLQIEVRLYDDGMALRYVFPDDGGWEESIQLVDDLTEFCFADDHTAWCYAGEHDPLGPQPLSKFRIGRRAGARLPLTVRCSSGTHLAVLEAAIFDLAPMTLAPSDAGQHAFRGTFPASTLARGGATSWRVLLVGQSAGDLLVSPVMYCLNPPCHIADTSWIQPGLALWDWRAWGATTEDGFTYGLDMPSWRRFIDFAAKHHIRYLVLDAGWYGLEFEKSSDPRTSRDYLLVQPDPQNPRLVPRPPPADWDDPIDIPELIQYARGKGVGIILYFNDIARLNYPFEETLALYRRWGAAGIKYGFMKGSGQTKVRETRKIVALCAQNQLLCDFHDGPVPPSGDRRTFPNYVTREFCHSQSDARRAFSPTGFCEQVFVNMLAGPLDMCNGLYTLENPARDRPKIFVNVNTTVVAETARVMIAFSGLSILPDCPEAYEAKSDLFDYLGKLPMTWDETRILQGQIGSYISTARRSGDQWFVASATNEEPRSMNISLDFLQPDRVYTATLYEDAPDAHYLENREAYRVRRMKVKRGDTIEASMAAGGGHCVHLQP